MGYVVQSDYSFVRNSLFKHLQEKMIGLSFVTGGVFCKSEFPVFARIPNNFPPGKFVNEFSLANS